MQRSCVPLLSRHGPCPVELFKPLLLRRRPPIVMPRLFPRQRLQWPLHGSQQSGTAKSVLCIYGPFNGSPVDGSCRLQSALIIAVTRLGPTNQGFAIGRAQFLGCQ